MNSLSEFFRRRATPWVTALAWIIFLGFTATALPEQAARATPAEKAAGAPDTSFYYNAAELYKMAEAYGAAGRAEYIRVRFTFDVLWPAVYTLFLMIAISRLLGRILPAGSPWRRANLLPLAAALFDFCENFSTSWVMYRYPQVVKPIAAMAGIFTAIKWLLVGLNFILLVAALGVWAWKRAWR